MTEKRPTPDRSAGKGRPKRAAPTIDLTATEVPANESPASESPTNDVPPVTSEADPPPPPVHEPMAAAPEAEPAAAASRSETSDAPRPSALTMPLLAAGVAGAAAMLIVLLALSFAGLPPFADSDNGAADARIAGLEAQLEALQKRPAQTTPSNAADTAAVNTLTERVGAADNAMKSLGVALTALNKRSDDVAATSTQARERAEAAEKAVADLRAGLQDVSKTANAGASSADLAPLQQRIAALEQTAKTANAEIAKATASDTAARLALGAMVLRDVVASGKPFAADLAQAKSLGADAKTTTALEPFAAAGLPSEKALASELSTLLAGMIKTAGTPPASGGFIERLQANAGQLVRIRPVDAPVGDDPSTVLARLEVDAAKADIAAALADLGNLTEAQRAPAQAWIAKAQGRQAALAAAQSFAADAARSLGSK